jgi:hypothetical protein
MKSDNARYLGTTARKLQYGSSSKAESNGSNLARVHARIPGKQAERRRHTSAKSVPIV